MADDEKTEEPTDKKIQDARKDGNVPRSVEVNSFITLLIALTVLVIMFSFMHDKLFGLYHYYQSFIGTPLTKNTIIVIAIESIKEILIMVLPIAVSVAIGGIISATFQFGFIFTTKPVTPDLKKIDPIKGIKNLFSLKKIIEALKTILKVGSVFTIAFFFLLQFIKESPHTVYFSIINQLIWLENKAIILIAVMLALFLVLALVDIVFVRYNYFKDLRMSKQEIKDEYKQMEGDPQVKSRIRKMQMEMVKKRMMQDIPQADVVITNPTHYAVALRYDKEKESAPVILAKGVDFLALRIKEIALNNQVQIVENPPLARDLYKNCDIGDAIPERLYMAVAEVLAFVYQSSNK